LTDTAGIRETDEIIEQEGIKRSIQAADIADLVLLVLDASLSSSQDDDLFSSLDPKKTLVVLNKADLLPSDRVPSSGILVSAKNLTGIDTLKQAIKQKLFSTEHLTSDQIILTKERHHQALVQAQKYLGLAIQGLQTGLSPELLSMDMRACLHELGTIIGTNITEDILNAIFSKFCVGK
jgi:tRNA modification GTPase